MPFDTPSKYPGIIIRMNSESDSVVFPTLVNRALDTIASKATGFKLLNGIANRAKQAKFGFTVCIKRANMHYSYPCRAKETQLETISTQPKPLLMAGTNKAVRGNETEAINGVGSITAITYNANMISTPDGDRPAWIGLAHELIHAYYNLKGKGLGSGTVMNVNGAVEQEEMATVGLGDVKQRSITENKIRSEHGLPIRKTYGGL